MPRESWTRNWIIAILNTLLMTHAVWLQPAEAGGLHNVVRSISGVFQRQKPVAAKDLTIEDLADQIDWLEFNIETYGTIVPKQPDVWGEARLTRHRQEFEREMFKEFGQFTETLQAAIRRTDQSYFGAAAAIGSSGQNNQDGSSSSSSSSVAGLIGDPNAEDQQIIARTAPKRIDLTNFQTDKLSLEPTVVLDQKARYLNHLNEIRRINEGDDITDTPGYALNLVRIPISVLPGKKTREGFGAELTVTADLYLTDDLLPKTFRNLIIEDVVDQLALPITNVLGNERLTAQLKTFIDDSDKIYRAYERLRWLDYHLNAGHEAPKLEAMKILVGQSIDAIYRKDEHPRLRDEAREQLNSATSKRDVLSLIHKLLEGEIKVKSDSRSQNGSQPSNAGEEKHKDFSEEKAKSTFVQQNVKILFEFIDVFREFQGKQPLRSRRSPLAYAPSQVHDVFGQSFHVLGHVTLDAHKSLAHRPNGQIVHLMDVQAFLRTELEAAYKLVTENDSLLLKSHCTPELIHAIRRRERKLYNEEETYNDLLNDVGIQSIVSFRNAYLNDIKRFYPRAAHTTTVSLGWAIIVEAALLNDRLTKDIREVAVSKGAPYTIDENEWPDFYMPKPSPAAIETFNAYVRCRWPIHVFALDPITQDQNVADIFNRRREMQLAISVAVANGKMSPNAASRFSRRLETDIETISLNRTAIGFSHGSDTFGWRFYPRVQAPPTPSTLGAFGQTVFGGPSADADLRHRQLDPAIRECYALVVMPSFVPQITLDTRANWFELTNPRKKMLTMNDDMKLSRSYQAIQSAMQNVCHSSAYRPGDIAHLHRVVGHLDRRMPLQNMLVEIPYENTSGGFELFSNGVTDLAPELIGWYGAPGVVAIGETSQTPPATVELASYDREHYPLHFPGTTLFLVGDGFSVHDTRVITGGKCIPYMLLSRQVMEVTIPTDVNLVFEEGIPYVDAHVATPYGISSHLLIPVVPASLPVPSSVAALQQRLAPMKFHVSPNSKLHFSFSYARKGGKLQALTLIDTDVSKSIAIEYDENAHLPLSKRSALDVLMLLYDGDTPLGKVEHLLHVNPTIDAPDGQIAVPAELIRTKLASLAEKSPLNKLTNLYLNGNKEALTFQAVFFVEPAQQDDDEQRKSALPVRIDGQLLLELHRQPEPQEVEPADAGKNGAEDSGAPEALLPSPDLNPPSPPMPRPADGAFTPPFSWNGIRLQRRAGSPHALPARQATSNFATVYADSGNESPRMVPVSYVDD